MTTRSTGRDCVTLLAFDFDGTLAPIQDDPARVVLDPAAAEFLAEAARAPGVVVAIASGRDSEDLASRLDGLPVYLIASHGLEIRGPYGRSIRSARPLALELDESIRRAAEACGLRIEKKTHGIALHWRGVRSLHPAHPVVEQFRHWAASNGLDVIDGRRVVEARMQGWGKDAALRWVSSATAAGRVIFAGDDVTDFGALQFAVEHGRGLFMRSDECVPPPGVTVVNSCEDLVRILRDEVPV